MFAGFVLLHRPGSNQELVESLCSSRRLVGEIPSHRSKWNENFIDIPAVIAGILLLLCHDTDYKIRNVVQVHIFAKRIATLRKELLRRVRAQKCHSTRVILVVPVVESPLADREAANVSELRIRTGHQKSCV